MESVERALLLFHHLSWSFWFFQANLDFTFAKKSHKSIRAFCRILRVYIIHVSIMWCDLFLWTYAVFIWRSIMEMYHLWVYVPFKVNEQRSRSGRAIRFGLITICNLEDVTRWTPVKTVALTSDKQHKHKRCSVYKTNIRHKIPHRYSSRIPNMTEMFKFMLVLV